LPDQLEAAFQGFRHPLQLWHVDLLCRTRKAQKRDHDTGRPLDRYFLFIVFFK
jgi:hypothetical protein